MQICYKAKINKKNCFHRKYKNYLRTKRNDLPRKKKIIKQRKRTGMCIYVGGVRLWNNMEKSIKMSKNFTPKNKYRN